MDSKLKIYVAEDHPLTREGIFILLNDLDCEIVGISENGQDTINWFKNNDADVLILDLGLPVLNGFDVMKFLNKNHNKVKTLVLSSDIESTTIKETYKLGAKGYILKVDKDYCLTEAINLIVSGKSYYSESVNKGFILEAEDEILLKENIKELSDREKEVMNNIAKSKDFCAKTIAADIGVNASTFRTYTERIRKKLGLKSNIKLVKVALSFFERN